ncbi:MAG: hypothetical protein C0501_27175 [Isosphaera sp.]|nr:hypothetical protein [Isosphaera sp.]
MAPVGEQTGRPARPAPSLRAQWTVPSQARYAVWRLAGRRYPLRARLRGGPRMVIRPNCLDDLRVADEVFVRRVYDAPWPVDPAGVEAVVDLGSNVGYTCLLWLWRFPRCRVDAFEPHPAHARQVAEHLALNGWAGRATVTAAAAGAAAGTARLTDAGISSRVSAAEPGAGADGRLDIAVVDWLAWAAGRRIDLLKMDIEGGEYDLLADPRFPALDIRRAVVEWHATDPRDPGREWCRDRLAAAGFEVRAGDEGPNYGLLWARRPR